MKSKTLILLMPAICLCACDISDTTTENGLFITPVNEVSYDNWATLLLTQQEQSDLLKQTDDPFSFSLSAKTTMEMLNGTIEDGEKVTETRFYSEDTFNEKYDATKSILMRGNSSSECSIISGEESLEHSALSYTYFDDAVYSYSLNNVNKTYSKQLRDSSSTKSIAKEEIDSFFVNNVETYLSEAGEGGKYYVDENVFTFQFADSNDEENYVTVQFTITNDSLLVFYDISMTYIIDEYFSGLNGSGCIEVRKETVRLLTPSLEEYELTISDDYLPYSSEISKTSFDENLDAFTDQLFGPSETENYDSILTLNYSSYELECDIVDEQHQNEKEDFSNIFSTAEYDFDNLIELFHSFSIDYLKDENEEMEQCTFYQNGKLHQYQLFDGEESLRETTGTSTEYTSTLKENQKNYFINMMRSGTYATLGMAGLDGDAKYYLDENVLTRVINSEKGTAIDQFVYEDGYLSLRWDYHFVIETDNKFKQFSEHGLCVMEFTDVEIEAPDISGLIPVE